MPVSIQNDANACALAEWKYGAGRGTENMIFLTFGTGLGAGLSILIDILNPQKIIIGSVFERSGELLRDRMQAVIDRETLPYAREVCEIVPAALGDSIGDFAAIAVAEDIIQK